MTGPEDDDAYDDRDDIDVQMDRENRLVGLDAWLPPAPDDGFFGVNRDVKPHRFSDEFHAEQEAKRIAEGRPCDCGYLDTCEHCYISAGTRGYWRDRP